MLRQIIGFVMIASLIGLTACTDDAVDRESIEGITEPSSAPATTSESQSGASVPADGGSGDVADADSTPEPDGDGAPGGDVLNEDVAPGTGNGEGADADDGADTSTAVDTSGSVEPSGLPEPLDLEMLGLISVVDAQGRSDAMTAVFTRLSAAHVSDVTAALEELTKPGCAFTTDANAPARDRVAEFLSTVEALDVESISAGERIVFTGPGGTYVELRPDSVEGEITVYGVGTALAELGPIPDDLVVDISGDAFPGFPTVRIPAPGSLDLPTVGTAGATAGVTAESSSFNLDITGDGDAAVSSSSSVSVSESGDGGGGGTAHVHCTATDGGTVSLPDSVRREIERSTADTIRRTSVAVQTYRSGRAVLAAIREHHR